MMPQPYMLTSLTRISDLAEYPYEVAQLPKSTWEGGDYVAVEILQIGSTGARLELPDGRMMDPLVGERLIGALGVRHATLEITGTWEKIEPNKPFSVLTAAGLLGQETSASVFCPTTIKVQYLGHVTRGEAKCTMQQMVKPRPPKVFTTPSVLLVGTSMSAGKTTTGRIITQILTQQGHRVAGAKLTGAGRYRDILAYQDAGAVAILDFVDAGLPSSICADSQFEKAMDHMLSGLAEMDVDVAVIELGASPLEPYHGEAAAKRIADAVKFKVLCASDPYAVLGVRESWGFVPDLISGPATNTLAGIELAKQLCDVPAINILEASGRISLEKMLAARF